MNKKALVTIARGSEELESVAIIDILRRADINVRVAGENDIVTCSRGVKIIPDIMIDAIDEEELFDAIVIPGGAKGVDNLTSSDQLAKIIGNHISNNRLIGAICAGPMILADHKLLPPDTHLTSHPSVKPQLMRYNYSSDRVVVSGNFITSRGPGTAIEFALKIVEKLAGGEIAEKIAKAMLHN